MKPKLPNQPSRPPTRAHWLRCSLLVTVCLAGWAGPTTETTADRARRIEAMTEAERMRLARNFEKYQRLTEAERDKYRELYQGVQDDPQLRALMEQFHHWWTTIDIHQRDELRREKNPTLREEMVRRLRDEQRRRERMGMMARRPGWENRGRDQFRGLSGRDLTVAMGVLEQKVRQQAKPDQLAKLRELGGFRRHVFVLEIIAEVLSRDQDLRRTFWQEAAAETWPKLEVGHRETVKNRWTSFFPLLVMGLDQELRSELDQKPSGDTLLEELKANLSEGKRREFEKLPPHAQQWFIIQSSRTNIFERFAFMGGGPRDGRQFRGPPGGMRGDGGREGRGPGAGDGNGPRDRSGRFPEGPPPDGERNPPGPPPERQPPSGPPE